MNFLCLVVGAVIATVIQTNVIEPWSSHMTMMVGGATGLVFMILSDG